MTTKAKEPAATPAESSTIARDLGTLEAGIYHLAEQARRMRTDVAALGAVGLATQLEAVAVGLELELWKVRNARQLLTGQTPDYQPIANGGGR